ncbi:Alpha-actinin, sarcomeric [Echinococcus granulosus]|uniref:Alpha actinin sarcomeric n=1 Tax=Echinococcus granulosus TaxID=6210 RepID=A0A068WCI4_ECHGR|nr:Alpha-actinin, sarcomeric [Echinococcus granulosus]CDS16144.1 alpha actinin sarcomeric [Echinococcus granulosus]
MSDEAWSLKAHQQKSIFEFEGYANDDDDEEIPERETPIDPIWEKQQKKTFTAWCNLHLKKKNAEITIIEEDFRNGLNLLLLLEAISGEQLSPPERGKLRVHKILNVNKALDFIQKKGVKLVGIAAEEIVDGNVKMTLGMIWTIILRFAIQDIQIENCSANDGLLLWCQRSTEPYPEVNVKNFNTSFKDGKAFCAIINRYRPDLLNFNDVAKAPARYALTKAFDVAEESLSIPKMLDVDDMIESVKPDDRSVITYVSCFFHLFAEAEKTGAAATRIKKAVEISQMSDQLCDSYNRLFTDLKTWIIKKKADFEHRKPVLNLEDVNKSIEGLRQYQTEEKPAKIEEKSRLETTFRTLQTRLRLNNRPPYLPSDGMLIADILILWKELEICEKNYEEWLMGERKRTTTLAYWLSRFEVRCKTFEAWASGKSDYLQSSDYTTCTVAEVRPMLKKHEAFVSDLMAQQDRVERIESIAQEIRNLGYTDMPSIDSRCAQIKSSWDSLKALSDKRHQNLSDAQSVLEKIDAKHLEIAKLSAPFHNWMQQAEEDLLDKFIAQSTADVEKLINAHAEYEKSSKEKAKEYGKIRDLEVEIEGLCKQINRESIVNPYTNVTTSRLHEQWKTLQELTDQRRKELEEEKKHQLVCDQVRRRFIQLATELNGWLEQTQGRLNNVGLGEASLEEQVKLLTNLDGELEAQRPKLSELEDCHQHLQDAYGDLDFPVPMATLRSVWNQLSTGLKYTRNEIENQILTRDSKGLSKSQLDDLRRCFNHFDKDHTGRLECPEFKACLVSVGHSIVAEAKKQRKTSVDTSDEDILKLMKQLDPNSNGSIAFDVFVDYMTRELTDLDTSDQLLQSFRTISGEKGYLTEADLRRELPPEQVQYILSKLHPLTLRSHHIRHQVEPVFPTSLPFTFNPNCCQSLPPTPIDQSLSHNYHHPLARLD